jgi:hypothetical protein
MVPGHAVGQAEDMTPTAVTTHIDDAGRTTTRIEYHGTIGRPPVFGSLAYLLLSFPLGVAWFVTLVTLLAVGASTAIVWVGLPVLATAIVLWRAGAQLERVRAQALLNTVIADGRRALPEGPASKRWAARVRDPQSWRDLLYLFLLFPLGIAEFVLMVVLWGLSLGLVTLPIHYRWMPDGVWILPGWTDGPLFVVDSFVDALPVAALGVLLLGVTVRFTQWLAGTHARYARRLLGPRERDAVAG